MKKQNMNTTTATTNNATTTPATETEKTLLSRVPVVAEKDSTPAPVNVDAAPINATADGAPVVDATPAAKTPADITRENKKKARDAAKTAYMNKYAGKPADALRVRVLTDDNKRVKSDFTFSYKDADGKKCNGAGVVRSSALLSTDAAKTFRGYVDTIDANAVKYYNARRNAGKTADEQNERAAAKNAVAPAVVGALNLCGYMVTEKTVKTDDMDAIVFSAYTSNAAGNDDTKNNVIPFEIESIARARLMGYTRRDDNAARRERKAAADAEKKAAKAATGKKKAAKK